MVRHQDNNKLVIWMQSAKRNNTKHLKLTQAARLPRHQNHHEVDPLCSEFRQFKPDLGHPAYLNLHQAACESVPFQVLGLHNAKIIAVEPRGQGGVLLQL
jgi:hypothetical protein